VLKEGLGFFDGVSKSKWRRLMYVRHMSSPSMAISDRRLDLRRGIANDHTYVRYARADYRLERIKQDRLVGYR
jgi:hypothetical protein